METGRRLENKHAGSEMTKNEMQIQFTAVSENEAFARIAVAAFVTPLNPTLEEIADIKTAVSEAVTNAIIHGYDGMTGKEQNQVYIHCLLNRDVLQVEVIDEGKGIEDVEKAMEPMYTTGGEERSGMGFTIMESFMDKLTVKSTPGKGTVVSMRKRIVPRLSGRR